VGERAGVGKIALAHGNGEIANRIARGCIARVVGGEK
jgi:hypothetical protein